MLHKVQKLIIAAMSVMVLISAQAYAITPSPQMIEQFKNLPKSEQMRLAQQYGIDPAQFTGQSNNQSQQLNNPQIVNPRANTLEQNLQVQQQKNLDFAEDSAKQALNPMVMICLPVSQVPSHPLLMYPCQVNILLALAITLKCSYTVKTAKNIT